MKYTVMDAETGRFIRHGQVPARDFQKASTKPNEIVIQGEFSEKKMVDPESMASGNPVLVDAPPNPVHPHKVRVEARHRINRKYPDWMQRNILIEGDKDELDKMRRYIQRVRDMSNVLERLDPIPQDFRDDKYWELELLTNG